MNWLKRLDNFLCRLFSAHRWEDITTPWNDQTITHLKCMNCHKTICAFSQTYKRSTQEWELE